MFELTLLHSSPACLKLNGKMTSPGGEVSPEGTAHDPLLSGLGDVADEITGRQAVICFC